MAHFSGHLITDVGAGAVLGAHSLRYDLKVVFQYGFVQSQILGEGHLDEKPFLYYDSEKGRAEPWGPWAEAHLGTETCDTETKDLTERGMELKMTLADIMPLTDQQKGLYSLQETLGCKIQEDKSARGFWHFFFDGERFLSYHPETQKWMVLRSTVQTLAVEIKKIWDADRDKSNSYSPRVQGETCGKLQKYLKSWMSFKEQIVPPAVNVTYTESVEGITLMCWASGFYPSEISLTWLPDGEPLSQDSQDYRCGLPYENGTSETCVSIRVPKGKEQRYSCHVEHDGKHTTYPVTIEHEQLQDPGQLEKVTADNNGIMQLGSQSLLSAPECVSSARGA
ncbi:MHC class I polypeptide-related sequence B-like [Orycteropus afer afer]|uniref:MHC class I polypeptide-related sequence B-like n=1 Tax=Orycteropus afer afer TaxID=1230840 RepID=A0A8B7APJ7_ORYAF|nr:MHC class I polypeptide-related sequence B-like [Orycteropus afer afer]